MNQLGFLPNEYKSAIILSETDLENGFFEIIETVSGNVVFKSDIKENIGQYGNFNYTYKLEFSDLILEGKYFLKVEKEKSYSFSINKSIYNHLAPKLLDFFKIQRCGYTNPTGHEVCHIADATSIINTDGSKLDGAIDLTGGWHDAGDYVKFLNTTAYATYTLLFSYEFDKKKFGFDLNKNNIPDILEEAKIGLDWLHRCNFEKYKLISSVQDLRDHTVGWRMPENDSLTYDRPAFVGIGKNTAGLFTATMAIASRIWKEDMYYEEYSEKCLTAAENIYSVRNEIPDIDSSGCGMYIDNTYLGKLALGAIELYNTTKRPELLNEAVKYADSAGADYWWSWGNINTFAHYKIARHEPVFSGYILNNINHFLNSYNQKIFGEGAAYSWGTNNTLLGVTLHTILWQDLTGEDLFMKLGEVQRDFILGRNPWGKSFIYKTGKNFVKNLHHQILFLNKKKFEGGFAAGPIKREILDSYNLPFEKPDRLKKFQTDDAYYRDDRMDYVSNEPTITANATAIFVMGYYSSR
ncbi:MAG: glycoside hydrolase family 9 protein [Tenericutes bacterium]|nr:glycoside hydrolase family 9 protein [Mycoplasmatota bacterium]MBI9009678.1 glycoside hydrolase family 9 protein [Mycoplasmatota bacterium]